MAPYVLAAGEMNATSLQAAVGQRYHVGFGDGTHFYGYVLVADTAQSGGWHEKTDITAKDQLTQYASPNIIDRDFVFWPRVSQGDWSGGSEQITFIDPTRVYWSDLNGDIPGYLRLRPNQVRKTVKSNASPFTNGKNFHEIVSYNGDFWFSFSEAANIPNLYNTNSQFTLTISPALIDTDGNNLFVGDAVSTINSYGTNGALIETNINALAGGLTSFDTMFVLEQGTSGHFLYYANFSVANTLFKVDLSLAKPIAPASHAQVPLDNIVSAIFDIVRYQNGIAILTSEAVSPGFDVWFHDGANLTPIVHVDGYVANGMCTCWGDLFVSAYSNVSYGRPALFRISSGSVSKVAEPGRPLPVNIQQQADQPRSSTTKVYWPYMDTTALYASTREIVGVYDAVTGAYGRLPNFDVNDMAPIPANWSRRKIATSGESVASTLVTGTSPTATLRVQYLVNNSNVQTQTPLFMASGKLVTSRFDFQTPGVEKRWRRFEAQHSTLPTNCSIKVDAFIDKDPAAYTASLTPDATVTNTTVGTVSTELFLNNLIGHTIYYAITLATSDGLNTPVLYYYFTEASTPWSWEMLLDCMEVRTLLTGALDDQGVKGKDLAYFFRNAWESPAKLTMYHRNGNAYTVAIESLDLWNPSPHVAQEQQVRDEGYQVKVILRQTL
jgi:hypothetical protein